MSDPIELDHDHATGVVTLTLDRPDHGNAINDAFCRQLRRDAEALHDTPDVRVIVVRARGRAHCVGGDLAFFAGVEDVEAALRDLAEDFHAGIAALRGLDAPVITAVSGVAAGGGLSLVAMCDVIVAADTARFTGAYTAAGLSPDGGLTWTLPRKVGWQVAGELLLLNRVIDAAEAQRIGLVNQVVALDALDTTIGTIAAQLAAGPTGAYGTVKRLLAQSAQTDLATQLDTEGPLIAANAATPDGREGVAAFLAKRRPSFGAVPAR